MNEPMDRKALRKGRVEAHVDYESPADHNQGCYGHDVDVAPG
jgi:hypothetical protein